MVRVTFISPQQDGSSLGVASDDKPVSWTIAPVSSGPHGWSAGDLFVRGDSHDHWIGSPLWKQIQKIQQAEPDAVDNFVSDWQLDNPVGAYPEILSGMAFDNTGLFGGNLIVSSIAGRIYLVDAQGNYAQLAQLPKPIFNDEGGSVVVGLLDDLRALAIAVQRVVVFLPQLPVSRYRYCQPDLSRRTGSRSSSGSGTCRLRLSYS
jgi:hypothetical protein